MQFAAPTHEHGDVLPLPSVWDADAENRDDRTDGAPTGPSRLRVPEMRVGDERLGVTRDGPPGGPASGGRGYQLTQHPPFSIRVTFYRREGQYFSSAQGRHPADPHRLHRRGDRIEVRRICRFPAHRCAATRRLVAIGGGADMHGRLGQKCRDPSGRART
jgi:hypothetical protein